MFLSISVKLRDMWLTKMMLDVSSISEVPQSPCGWSFRSHSHSFYATGFLTKADLPGPRATEMRLHHFHWYTYSFHGESAVRLFTRTLTSQNSWLNFNLVYDFMNLADEFMPKCWNLSLHLGDVVWLIVHSAWSAFGWLKSYLLKSSKSCFV